MIDRNALTAWYMTTFLSESSHYALMNPTGHDAKYSRRNQPLTADMITGALNGQTRRTRPNKETDQWQTVVCSYATVPQTKNGKAKAIILEIDAGGAAVAASTLAWLRENGIWAFAQLSQSDKHNGAHIWIICAEWQPATYLHDIARRIIHHLELTADAYPTDSDLRLPLMTHLRAPGGPRRFDLLTQDGEIIDASEPWAALARLQEVTQTTTTRQLIDLADKLPSLPIGGGKLSDASTERHAVHKSKVVPSNIQSVIAWYNDNHKLRDLLKDWYSVEDDRSTIVCPFHDDHSPSLSIWTVDKKQVCACRSTQSNCPASMGSMAKHWDAFDLYCHKNNLTAKEAVTRLVEEYGLGKKREMVIEETEPTIDPVTLPTALELHKETVTAARRALQTELYSAAQRKGEVTIIRATMGMGKTHQAAELANALQAQGLTVAIVAPTLAVAETEWLTRLNHAHVWRSKIDICTCHDKAYLAACIKYGFAYPKCTNHGCPYYTQGQKAFGKIIIFQHVHLALSEFAETNVIIVDENPLSALLPEYSVTPGMLAGFIKRHPEDAAAPLCRAMLAAVKELPQTMIDVGSANVVAAIERHLDGWTLEDAMFRARRSKFNVEQPSPPELVENMAPQFLAPMLNALTDNLPGFRYGKSSHAEKYAYTWHTRRHTALKAYNSLMKPAIVVLDGSANEQISRRLFEPWPVNFVTIDCPLSPLVEVTQVTCTTSTRHVLREQNRIESLGRNVAMVCNRLGANLTGGVTYKAALDTLQDMLGGQWLGYGAQRGSNELANAGAIAVVCSPTTPPAALERKALALWPDVDCTWQKCEGKSEYVATDARLQQVNLLSAYEELRQSVYRARPLTADAPMQLLVFSPWALSEIGITPHRVISDLPHHNSKEATSAAVEYRKRVGENFLNTAYCNKIANFNAQVYIEAKVTPPIENGQNVAVQESEAKSPPPTGKEEVFAPAVKAKPAKPSQVLRIWLGNPADDAFGRKEVLPIVPAVNAQPALIGGAA